MWHPLQRLHPAWPLSRQRCRAHKTEVEDLIPRHGYLEASITLRLGDKVDHLLSFTNECERVFANYQPTPHPPTPRTLKVLFIDLQR